MNVYAIYHNSDVLVLFDKKNNLVKTGKGDLSVCRYAFKGDKISKKYIVRSMKFDQFLLLIRRNNFKYFNYYKNPKNKFNFHLDTVKAFNKKELDEFLKNDKNEMKEYYSFLNI